MRARRIGIATLAALAASGCVAKHRAEAIGARPPVFIRISDFKFTPAELVVSMRDSVVWVNDDAFAHTTTADNRAWASAELPKGGRFALVAPAPGRYAYHCAAHPTMKAVLEVRLEE